MREIHPIILTPQRRTQLWRYRAGRFGAKRRRAIGLVTTVTFWHVLYRFKPQVTTALETISFAIATLRLLPVWNAGVSSQFHSRLIDRTGWSSLTASFSPFSACHATFGSVRSADHGKEYLAPVKNQQIRRSCMFGMKQQGAAVEVGAGLQPLRHGLQSTNRDVDRSFSSSVAVRVAPSSGTSLLDTTTSPQLSHLNASSWDRHADCTWQALPRGFSVGLSSQSHAQR